MIRPVSCRLEAAGLPTLSLVDGPIRVARLNLGDAATREVVEFAPDADGTIDTTRFVGARPVTLEATLSPTVGGVSRWELAQRLRAFTRADIRPRLFWQHEAGDPELMVTLRRSQFADVLEPHHGRREQVTVQWIAPSGLIESAELQSVFAPAGSFDEQPGRQYDLEFDRVYPEAVGSSSGGLAVNRGTAAVWPVVTLYGPFEDGVELVNDATGEALVFVSSLDIAAGDWLRIDFAAKTIRNSTGTSYYDSLDFPSSTWWRLQPGENRVLMTPGGAFTTPPAGALIEWRSAWL